MPSRPHHQYVGSVDEKCRLVAYIEEGSGTADKAIGMPSVPTSPDRCPIDIDTTAEAYVMGRLSPTDALHFEKHCLTCRHCAAAAEEAEWFVRAMQVATLRSGCSHLSGSGCSHPLYGWVGMEFMPGLPMLPSGTDNSDHLFGVKRLCQHVPGSEVQGFSP